MSPARKKAKSVKSVSKPKRGKRPAAKAPRRAKASKPKAAKTAKGKGPGGHERRQCVAMDPFGDPCQSAPRPGSRYCTIHSYLDR